MIEELRPRILWVEDWVDLERLALRHEIAQEAVSMGRTSASTTEEGKRPEGARETKIDGSMKTLDFRPEKP